MSIDATVSAMVDAGCSPEQIKAVVCAHMAEQRRVEEEKRVLRRAGNAERQRRHRERNAHNGVTERDDALCGVTERDVPSQVLPPRDNNSTPNSFPSSSSLRSETTVERDPKKSGSRGCRLPADWTPDDASRAMASELLGNSGARAELEKFRDYWAAQPGSRGVKSDWEATWRNWVRKASESPKQRAGPQMRPSGRETLVQIAMGNFYDEPQSSEPVSPQFSAERAKPSDRDLDIDLSEQGHSDAGGRVLDFSRSGSGWR